MILAAILGLLSGVASVAVWGIYGSFVQSTGLEQWISQNWYWTPLILGGVSIVFLTVRGRRANDYFADSWPDLQEEFHFGIQRSSATRWGFRGIVGTIGFYCSEVFGPEGLIIDGLTAFIQAVIAAFPQRFHDLSRRDGDFRQLLVVGAVSGALASVFSASFAGAILTLELLMVHSARVRSAAFLSAIVAFGTVKVLGGNTSWGHAGTVMDLLKDLHPSSLTSREVVGLGLLSIIFGIAVAAFCHCFALFIAHLHRLKLRLHLDPRLFTAVVVLSLAVMAYLTPLGFAGPKAMFHQLTSSPSSFGPLVIAILERGTFIALALVVLGTSGFISPMILLGVLMGYAAGLLTHAPYAPFLALAGAATMLSSSLGAPLGAITFVLEASPDGPTFWIAGLSVFAAAVINEVLRWEPLLTQALRRRGIDLKDGRCINVLTHLKIKDAMIRDFSVIRERGNLGELQNAAVSSPYNVLGVVGQDGCYRGLLSLDQLPNNVELKGIESADLLDRHATTVSPDDPLEKAFGLLTHGQALAVVDDKNCLVGLLFKTGVIARYQREVGRRALAYYAHRKQGKVA